MRATADSAAAIVGALPSDTVGIQRVGAPTGDWAQIEAHGLSGWVNAKYLARSMPTAAPTVLNCSGSEPFWSLHLEGGRATLTVDKPQTVVLKDPIHPSLTPQPWLFEPEKAGALSFFLVEETRRCVEGMGEGLAPARYDVFVRTGDRRLLAGCCTSP